MRVGTGTRTSRADRGRAKHWGVVGVRFLVPDVVDQTWSALRDVSWNAALLGVWIARGPLDGDLHASKKQKGSSFSKPQLCALEGKLITLCKTVALLPRPDLLVQHYSMSMSLP